MDSNEHFKSTIGFIDLLFNILVGFAFLFIVAFLLIKPEAKKKDFDRRAEYVVVMEWNHDAKDDIDLYVGDPLGGIASFRHPKINFSHLDKDDLGTRNDSTVMADGSTTTVKINREVLTIRGIIPGQWIANAHYYSSYAYGPDKNPPDYFITVKIELHRVNPYQILWVGEKKFTHKGQEETFVRWTLDKMGGLVGQFEFEKKNFVMPGAVGSNESGFRSTPSFSAFSDMNLPDNDGPGEGNQLAGPMEGFNEAEEVQKELNERLGVAP